MANSSSSKKRARQSLVRRARCMGQRSLVRTVIKKVLAAVEAKEVEQAKQAYQAAVPIIDRMSNKNIIHKKKAARHKSRLNAKIKALVLSAA